MKPRVIIYLECDSVLREPKVVKALEDLGIEITGTAYNPTSRVNVGGNKEIDTLITMEEFKEKVFAMLKGNRACDAINALYLLVEDLEVMKERIL